MDGIADFVLAFQYYRSHTPFSRRLGSRQTCRTTTNNQDITIDWHVYPSLSQRNPASLVAVGCIGPFIETWRENHAVLSLVDESLSFSLDWQ
jgi:hypothetical protein